ncbi:Tn3 family transposase [Pseudonocardia alni]|uniref:Tn3 family transposase n=1 Tax=Pseudonocardia alni TaxID=33907 RepID=UPI0033F2784C
MNTLMIQDVLDDPAWAARLGPEDYRGLTPLTWTHVTMHGEFKLNMSSRLTLGASS